MNAPGLMIEDFDGVDIADLRRAVGGRAKFRSLEAVTVHLADRDVVVRLTRGPSSFGRGELIYAACPGGCGRRARVLRIVPTGAGLLCTGCLREKLGAKYRSERRKHPRSHPSINLRVLETEPRSESEKTPWPETPSMVP
jgi:hypothetical protein